VAPRAGGLGRTAAHDAPVLLPGGPRKLKVATVSLAGCFGCHMSLLDIDERLLELIEHIEFDRSPLTDIKQSATATSA
jgi:NAD-reducing hydrogenase small subunit